MFYGCFVENLGFFHIVSASLVNKNEDEGALFLMISLCSRLVMTTGLVRSVDSGN